MTMARLAEHRVLWEAKPVLRAVYEDCYRRIVARCVSGLTLELGGGTGNLKSFRGDIITSDMQWAPWMDMVADAQRLPIRDASLDNIVMFDVLHHVESPLRFLAETQRVLNPGGRLVVCEPAITPLSGIFYRWFHPEPVHMGVNPLDSGEITEGRDPYAANQAIPTLLFGRFQENLQKDCPLLRMHRPEYFSLVVYPLSGGLPSVVARSSVHDRITATARKPRARLAEAFGSVPLARCHRACLARFGNTL